MSYKYTDNTRKIVFDTQQKAGVFLRFAADELVKLSTANTPKKTGRMRMDTIKQIIGLKGKVAWVKGYAGYQERGRRKDGTHVVKNYTTPGTGPHFAENAAEELVNKTSSIAGRVFK